MTKAKARQRAKANAAKKAQKRKAAAGQPQENVKSGQFNPGTGSIKSPGANPNSRNTGGARRGAARSR